MENNNYMRKTMMKDGKVVRLQEIVDRQMTDLNVNYRLLDIRKRKMYEDQYSIDSNLLEKVVHNNKKIMLDPDLIKAKNFFLKCDFQDFLKLMNFTMIKDNNNESTVRRDKEIKHTILKKLNIESQLNEKNHHKKCNVFHTKNDHTEDLSFTYNFKDINKSLSSNNMIKMNEENFRNNCSSTSFEKMLRNSKSSQKFTFSKSLKISLEKINFLNKKKKFSEKKSLPKKKLIILPPSNKDATQNDCSDSENDPTIHEKEEMYWEDGENPDIIKKRIILPKIEETQSPNRRDFNKTGKTVKLSTIFMDDEETSKKEKNYFQTGIKFSSSSKPKSIRLIKKPSLSNFNISINKIKEGSLAMSSSYNLLSPEKNQSIQKKIKNKSLDLLESKDKERKNKLINNISHEFKKLKNVKNEIHKTFDSALVELYEKALNNGKHGGHIKNS